MVQQSFLSNNRPEIGFVPTETSQQNALTSDLIGARESKIKKRPIKDYQ